MDDATQDPPVDEVALLTDAGVTRLTIRGELDLLLAARAQPSVDEILADIHPTPVLADLDGVSFIDLIGVALIVKLLRGLELQGRALAVVLTAPQPLRILRLSNLEIGLPLHRTIESGIRALTTPPDPVPS